MLVNNVELFQSIVFESFSTIYLCITKIDLFLGSYLISWNILKNRLFNEEELDRKKALASIFKQYE